MPNHIQNQLIVTSKTNEELDLFINAIKGEDEVIDFNTIIPMPQELKDTESSTKVDSAVAYFVSKTDKGTELKETSRFRFPSTFYTQEKFDKYNENELKELYELGERYYNIFKTYGYFNWYDWRLDNWGTKWNAYETSIGIPTQNSVRIFFQTAWGGVPFVISKLVEKFPKLEFEYKFADEDRGYNGGVGQGYNGEFEFDYLEDGSDSAYENYRDCWGYDESEFFKAEDGEWYFIDEYEEENE